MLSQLVLAALAFVVASSFDLADPGLIVETFTSAPVIWHKTFSEAAQGTQTGPLPSDHPLNGLAESASGNVPPGHSPIVPLPTFTRRWWYAYHNMTTNRTMTTTTLYKTRKFITTYYSNGTVVKTEVDGE